MFEKIFFNAHFSKSYTDRCRLLLFSVLIIGCSIAKNNSKPVLIMQISDPQFGFFTNNKSFEKGTENYTKAILEANRIKPDIVIVTGDLTNIPHDRVQIDEYQRISRMLDKNIKFYQLPGNHDIRNEPEQYDIDLYNKEFGKDYYTIEFNGKLAIVLNSLYLKSPDRIVSGVDSQFQWPQQILENSKTKYKNIIVFIHHPLFLENADEPDQYFNIPTRIRKIYLDLLSKYNITHIFAGHLHRNYFGTFKGMEMVTSGPVGKPFGKDSSGIRMIKVNNQSVTHQYISLDSLPYFKIYR